jgi:cytochrome c553
MVKRIVLFCIGLMLSNVGMSADMANGKKLSVQCSVCHGKDGVSRNPEAPNLAGMSSLYFEKSLIDYQKGDRHDRRMSLIAQTLTKDQIKDLASWYSSFEITVKVPGL